MLLTGPAPGLLLPGCKQTHAFAVANRRGQSGGGGLLQTKSNSLPSARPARCAGSHTPAPRGAERSAHGAPPSGQGATRALCPPCLLAQLQMARARGPTCALQPLRQPGPICPQAPAQRSRDKYTQTPGVPAWPICLSGARRGSVPGLLPAPLMPPSGTLSSRSPRALPREAHRVPPKSPTRRLAAPAPGAADLRLSRLALPRGPETTRRLSQDTSSSSKLSLDPQVPRSAPRARGALTCQSLGRLPGAERARAAAQSPATDERVDSRTGPTRCPWAGGWRPQWYLASRAGTRGAPLRPVQSALLPAERSGGE